MQNALPWAEGAQRLAEVGLKTSSIVLIVLIVLMPFNTCQTPTSGALAENPCLLDDGSRVPNTLPWAEDAQRLAEVGLKDIVHRPDRPDRPDAV